jgi:hypothetical protein
MVVGSAIPGKRTHTNAVLQLQPPKWKRLKKSSSSISHGRLMMLVMPVVGVGVSVAVMHLFDPIRESTPFANEITPLVNKTTILLFYIIYKLLEKEFLYIKVSLIVREYLYS